MRTFHVVIKDLKLRLSVDASIVGKKQILVRLLRVSAMRILSNENLAVKNSARLIVQYPFIALVRYTIRHLMVDRRMRIRVLRTTEHIKSVYVCFASFSSKLQIDIMTSDRSAKINVG